MYTISIYNTKMIKKFFCGKEIFFPEYLQNLKGGGALYSVYYTKDFFQYAHWFGYSSFPPFTRLFDSRTVWQTIGGFHINSSSLRVCLHHTHAHCFIEAAKDPSDLLRWFSGLRIDYRWGKGLILPSFGPSCSLSFLWCSLELMMMKMIKQIGDHIILETLDCYFSIKC